MSPHNGEVALMHGRVTDLVTKKPIAGAVVDIWQASSNGKYDFQDPANQVDNNLRGKFRTDEHGNYHFYCLRPTAYSLPTDGKLHTILAMLDANTNAIQALQESSFASSTDILCDQRTSTLW